LVKKLSSVINYKLEETKKETGSKGEKLWHFFFKQQPDINILESTVLNNKNFPQLQIIAYQDEAVCTLL
jgi:hypothetical protein